MTNIDFIKKGKNTSDATATANDIINPKTAYVNNEKITGAIMPTYISNAKSILTSTSLSTTNFDTFSTSCVLAEHNKVISVQDSKVNIYNIQSNNLSLNKSINMSELGLTSDYTLVWCGNYDSTNNLYYIIFTKNRFLSDEENKKIKICKFLVETDNIVVTSIPETMITTGLSSANKYGGVNLILPSPTESNKFLIFLGSRDNWFQPYVFLLIINQNDIVNERLFGYDSITSSRLDSFSWTTNNIITIRSRDTSQVSHLNINEGSMTNISMYNGYNTILISKDELKAISEKDNTYYYSDISINNNNIVLTNIKQIPSGFNPRFFTNCNDIFICTNSSYEFVYITYNIISESFETSYVAYNTYLSSNNLQDITNQNTNFILSSNFSNNLEFNSANQITSIKTELNTEGQSLIKMQRNNVDFYNIYDADTNSSDLLENKIAYGTNGKIIGTMANNGALSYTPSTQSQSIPAGYTSGGTISAVTSSIDSNIQAGNIKSGVSILGISGTYEGSGVTPDTTIANGDYGLESMTSGEGNNDIGYKFFANANTQSKLYEVGSIVEVHITNELLAQVLGITADKIKSGEVICGIEGTYAGETEV